MNRARERFDLHLSRLQYARLVERVEQVEEGTTFLFQSTPTRTVWMTSVHGIKLRVVYDEATARLVTCMPPYNPKNSVTDLSPDEKRRLKDGLKWKKIRLSRM